MSCESTSFISAPDARLLARDNLTIFHEICHIQTEILNQIALHKYSVIVPGFSDTDDPTAYHEAYNDVIEQRELLDQIEFVEDYFVKLGYNVQIQTNPITENTLQWYILW